MKKLQLGQWQIEYDRAATQAAYHKMDYVNQQCSCKSCENYFYAVKSFPINVLSFFDELGIDPQKPSEVYDCGVFKDGKLLYGGFYHIVGNYLSGADAWQPVNKKKLFKNTTHRYLTPLYELNEDYKVGFTQLVSLVPEDFPKPMLQMEITFNAPWVIETQ